MRLPQLVTRVNDCLDKLCDELARSADGEVANTVLAAAVEARQEWAAQHFMVRTAAADQCTEPLMEEWARLRKAGYDAGVADLVGDYRRATTRTRAAVYAVKQITLWLIQHIKGKPLSQRVVPPRRLPVNLGQTERAPRPAPSQRELSPGPSTQSHSIAVIVGSVRASLISSKPALGGALSSRVAEWIELCDLMLQTARAPATPASAELAGAAATALAWLAALDNNHQLDGYAHASQTISAIQAFFGTAYDETYPDSAGQHHLTHDETLRALFPARAGSGPTGGAAGGSWGATAYHPQGRRAAVRVLKWSS